MPLDARGVAHILANRAKIEAGRSETITLVAASGGIVGYQAVAGCLWHDASTVPAGVSDRVGQISRTAWDAILVCPSATAFPDDLVLIARTATATAAGVTAAVRYQVLERRREGLGTRGSGGGTNYGDRWVLKLRKLR